MEETEPNAFPKKQVFFRADANSQIGLGHLIRSMALAEMLKPEFKATFLIQNPAEAIQQQITASGFKIFSLPETLNYNVEATYLSQNVIRSGSIMVLDGYSFDTQYQEILKQHNIKLICIDDIHAFTFLADVIINQAGSISPQIYKATSQTKFCLGPAYALLRQPFLLAAQQTRTINQFNRIFLNMGGADPQNETLRIIHLLEKETPQIEIEVVIGSAYSHLPELNAVLKNNIQIRLHQQLDAKQMCQLMAQCDAAILPPSSVSYEWCSVGGPLFIHQTAENQTNIASFLLQEGLAFPLKELFGFVLSSNLESALEECLIKQRRYFNGKSPQKLRKVFFELYFQTDLQLRLVSTADMLLLYNWANDPAVRENSFISSAIPLPVHQIWFKNKLQDKNCFFLIAEIQDKPAGMIRFDLKDDQAVISYLLGKNFRGKGLGSILLQKGEEAIRQYHPEIKTLIGHVQDSNKASYISFFKNQYQFSQALQPMKPGAVVFEKNLN